MKAGIKRRPFQILPQSRVKVTCVKINDGADLEQFEVAFRYWHKGGNPLVPTSFEEWDYVLVVPLSSVRRYEFGNDGMQAWRHREIGYVIPDHCRQTEGCPTTWNARNDIKGAEELKILNLAEIEEFVVLNHKTQATKRLFAEAYSMIENDFLMRIQAAVHKYDRKLDTVPETEIFNLELQRDLARECVVEVDKAISAWRTCKRKAKKELMPTPS